MLSQSQNGLLTQTGPGTPLGELYRRYWIPALLSAEIPAPDCDPVRVKLGFPITGTFARAAQTVKHRSTERLGKKQI